ncbi:MAG: hypothetical protein BWZ02_02794 [Lentisphaerae bacterium ADurb.BinA184]|nr:MAG: hypothetical protein BWZ02_02794 [Lentisphaerae bacterium ADurb.BinA184]
MRVHWGVHSLQCNGEYVMNADSISVADCRELAARLRAVRLASE